MKGWAPPGEPEDASGCTAWPPASEHLSCGMAPLGRGVARASWDTEFVAVQASAGWLSRSGPPLAPMREGTRLCRVSHVPAGGPPGSRGPRGGARGHQGRPPPPSTRLHSAQRCNTNLGQTWTYHLRILGISSRLQRKLVPNLPPCHNRGGVKDLRALGVGSALRPHSLPPTSPRGARASSVLAPSPAPSLLSSRFLPGRGLSTYSSDKARPAGRRPRRAAPASQWGNSAGWTPSFALEKHIQQL